MNAPLRPHTITIRHVADRAGVSISTVSRVLNETCPVDSEKSRRVLEAARDLGYTPNPSARSLLKRKTGGVGVLLPFVSGEFFSQFLTGIDLTAQELGYFLLISTSHHSKAEWRTGVRNMHGRVDGLIVMAPQLTPGQLDLKLTVPTVFVNSAIPRSESAGDIDVINFDNERGTSEMVAYLVELGHRRIAYVCGPAAAHDAQERLVGFRRAMQAAGLSEEEGLVFDGDYTHEAGYQAARQIAALPRRPTAILGANDYCAGGIVCALRDAGLSVPGDISVVGFDDVPSSRFSQPPLTTVHVPIQEIGVAAMERLAERMRAEAEVTLYQRNMPVGLVIRQSALPPPVFA